MLIGYARTSTVEQEAGYDAQIRDLAAAGAEKVFGEQVSSVDIAARDQLAAALDFAREGDKLLVTKLDRLGSVDKGGSQTLPDVIQHWSLRRPVACVAI